MAGKAMTAAEVIKEVEKDNIFYEESVGGVTFSGGEPFMQPEFLLEMLKSCKKKGIHTAVDTCGFVKKDILGEHSGFIDLFLYDLKMMDEAKHKKYTGVSNELMLNNLKELTKLGKRIFIRIPIIPGINDDDANLEETGKFLSALNGIEQINLLPYHNIAMEKYKRLGSEYSLADIKTPSDDRMDEIAQKLKAFGFKVKIGG
ncbi:Pyruvate formate-lyase 1-activating enzyme [bioreactor metagenome]|uniref:Pyruvate formate-lyase 1-activating enzyme n=2 Tax=root TaxID=1 RepID=A0A645HP27_9ZZZZ